MIFPAESNRFSTCTSRDCRSARNRIGLSPLSAQAEADSRVPSAGGDASRDASALARVFRGLHLRADFLDWYSGLPRRLDCLAALASYALSFPRHSLCESSRVPNSTIPD